MAKLTDTQLIVLSKAAQRGDGAAGVPNRMNKAAAAKVGASLVVRRLMREIRAKPGMPVWRTDDDGRRISLIITRAGREAIGVAEDAVPTLTGRDQERKAVPRQRRKMERFGHRRLAPIRFETGAPCRDAVEGQRRDARRPGRGDGLAAAHDAGRDHRPSQAWFCDRTNPRREARIAVPDRRRSDGFGRGLSRWRSQP